LRENLTIHRFARKRLPFLLALLILLVLYGAAVAYIDSIQRNLLYFPSHSYVTPREALADPALTEFPVRTADGIALKGWYAPATTKPLTLVYFHGNADDLESAAPVAAIYIRAGYGVLIAEYRGYSGLPGSPTEAGLYADARAYVSALIASGVQENSIVLFGRSLGTGVAAQMAAEFHAGGLILLSPYRSIPEVAKSHFWFLPVDLLMKDRFDTAGKIKSITVPLLIANGGQDQVIPPSQGRDLFAMASEPKQFYFAVPAGHNDMFGYGFTAASVEWLDGLSLAGRH
jgi:fermentation-respiration switch protein FrsA (DUF1100 family)